MAKDMESASLNSKLKGILIMFSATFFFSLMGLLARIIRSDCTPYQMVFFRSFVMLLLMLHISYFRRSRIQGRNYKILILRGIFGGTALLLFFISLTHLKLAQAYILNKTSPIFSAILAYFFLGERFTLKKFIALFLTFIGLFLSMNKAGTTEFDFNLYFWIGLLSGVLSAAAYVCIKKVKSSENSETIVSYFALSGILISLIPTVRSGFNLEIPIWLTLIGIGLSAAVGQFLMTTAYNYLQVTEATMLSSATIINTSLLGLLILHEKLSFYNIAGASLVILAIILIATDK